jgi:hypothetical protein
MDRLGCKIVNNIADFINYEFFYRIILVDTSENNYRNTQIPSKQIIIGKRKHFFESPFNLLGTYLMINF